ncbi:unnamed protein product [Paramecium pentaurelia]|uniref:Uncharacterized protein n=1 Tax=Paramecium pentaurelia TaxID=43138 RepID=A0A8S1XTC7_9CILI|nr:unnamed protein product [Paramecium pentaurelia]
MNDYYILLYGSIPVCLPQVIGNLQYFWKNMGNYRSDKSLLCSRGMFHIRDQKKMLSSKFTSLQNDLELKILINKLLYDAKWNFITLCLRFDIKEMIQINIKKGKSIQTIPIQLISTFFLIWKR